MLMLAIQGGLVAALIKLATEKPIEE